jgi:predicted nucleic acid-binding protein
MPGDPEPVFVDTNVLIYANLALSPFHAAATDALHLLNAAGAQVWISRQVLREYLAGMTRPGALTGTISTADLVADIRSFSEQFFVAEDGPGVTDELVGLFTAVPMAGKQVHDANIVATMLANGIHRLLTHNVDDFKRFAKLIHVVPLVLDVGSAESSTLPAK